MEQYSDATYAYLKAMLGVLANQLQKTKTAKCQIRSMCVFITLSGNKYAIVSKIDRLININYIRAKHV